MNGRTKSALFGGIATLAVLAGAEGLARLADTVSGDLARSGDTATETWLAYSPTLGWERRPDFRGEIAGVKREFDAAGYVFIDSPQVASGSNERRVLFFGDSNTSGFGVAAEETFIQQVEQRVPGVSAINLGVNGYSSYQGLVAVKTYLPVLKPDLIVVSFNFNDRRYVSQAAEADGPAAFERGYAANGTLGRAARALEYVHLYRDMRSMLQSAGLVPARPTRVDVAGLVPRVDEESYRRNLTSIAEHAHRAGVPVVFVALNDNPLQSDHLNRGIAALERKDQDAALAYLTSASASHRMFSNLARIYLAQVFTARGDAAKARSTLANGDLFRSFSGGTVVRRDSAYNDIMRQVARATGATVVEAGAALNKRPSVYTDYSHFNTEGHRIVADLLAPRVAALLGLRTAPGG
ncbi:MAG TPA: SGNH/GDSL hydrolase family protein [Burkholderiales bacterium]|nr:SGNH/GDSL hydrolase family protein [Burkholderiales bacterium]